MSFNAVPKHVEDDLGSDNDLTAADFDACMAYVRSLGAANSAPRAPAFGAQPIFKPSEFPALGVKSSAPQAVSDVPTSPSVSKPRSVTPAQPQPLDLTVPKQLVAETAVAVEGLAKSQDITVKKVPALTFVAKATPSSAPRPVVYRDVPTVSTFNRYGVLKVERATKRKMVEDVQVKKVKPNVKSSGEYTPKKFRRTHENSKPAIPTTAVTVCGRPNVIPPNDLQEAGPCTVVMPTSSTPAVTGLTTEPTTVSECLPKPDLATGPNTVASRGRPSKRQAEDSTQVQAKRVQRGRGLLDFAVNEAVEENNVIPNNRTTGFKVPRDFQVISDASYFIHRFRLTTRRLEVRSHGDVIKFIERLLDVLMVQVAPEEKVSMSIASASDSREVCHISFRRAKFLDAEKVLKAIKAMIQSGTLNDHFLDEPVRIVFHRCEPIQGRGRRGQRKGVQNLLSFSKNSKSIIQINNDDDLCLPRAIVVAIAEKETKLNPGNSDLERRYKALRDSRKPSQKKAAIELIVRANVDMDECSTAIAKFQAVINYQIVVFEYKGKLPIVTFKGNALNSDGTERPKIYLLNEEDHFVVVAKPHCIFGDERFCEHCLKAYRQEGRHKCEATCSSCFQSPPCTQTQIKICNECNRFFRNTDCFNNHKVNNKNGNSICSQLYICSTCHKFVNRKERKGKVHNCNEVFCTICDIHVAPDHQCFIKPKPNKPKKDSDTIYVFYDLEAVQVNEHEKGGLVHQTYLCVSQKVCLHCIDSEVCECQTCGVRERVFEGGDCVSSFMDYVCSFGNSKIICIAHNAKAYDLQFILKHMLEVRKWAPEVIQTGTKLMRVEYENLTFLDSINYIPLPLSKFSASFGLPPASVKGYHPHFLFNVVDHTFDVDRPHETNYSGDTLPPIEAYEPDSMSSGDRTKFLKWYEEHKQNNFNFMRESQLYCRMDVTVLRQGCSIYRKLYVDIANVDPFMEASTIAGTCMAIFKKHFLKGNQIGIIPAGGYRMSDTQSVAAIKYLAWVEQGLGRHLESAVHGREHRIQGMKVDGFDAETGTIWEFHGCYWHGHTCIQDRLKPYFNDPHSTAQTRFEQTQHKTQKLRDMGYTVIEQWECEWDDKVAGDSELKAFIENYRVEDHLIPLNPRDAFFGGRTEAIQLYHRCETQEKMLYQDFTSLYPWVNKNGKYPQGHPRILLGDEIPSIDQCEGVLKCSVLPPRGLYLPVLPIRLDGKLMFTLCTTCATDRTDTPCTHTDEQRSLVGTWVTCELQKAVSVGYTIVRKYELWQYDQTTQYDKVSGSGGIFAGYVNMFLRLKQEASGWPASDMTEGDKRKYIADYKLNEGIDLDYDRIKVNPGLRQIAKLNLNSLWGKLGQRPDLTRTEIISDPEKWFSLIFNPSVEVNSVMEVSQDIIVAKWKYAREVEMVQRSQSVVIAAYTTAIARLKLYSVLEILQERVLYYDTDSVIYTCKPGEEALATGDYLGELTDELSGYGPGAYIQEFASGGSKNYGYKVAENETFKCKGIRLNYRNGSIVNFDTLKRQLGVDDALTPEGPVTVTEPRGIVRLNDHTIVSKPQTKTYRIVYDKRRRLSDFKTLPWGF